MMLSSFRHWNKGYEPLEKASVPTGVSKSRRLGALIPILAATALFVTAFYAGEYHGSSRQGPVLNLSTAPRMFAFDPNFGDAPSNLTNSAWDSLFPLEGGFFRHPHLAPQRSAFSVFHQLHCLDGIRQGYFMMLEMAQGSGGINPETLSMHTSPYHMRHCIDFLRQALMCQPDLTIELKDESKGGVTGFGTEHMCKDWDELLQWTSQWEFYGAEA